MKAIEAIREFDAWITKEYNRLRERLSVTGAFDEDAFHDAYIRVREAMAEDSATDNYSTAFYQAYKKISKRHVSEAFAVYNPEETFFSRLADKSSLQVSEPARERKKGALACEIRKKVRRTYKPMLVLIWESRVLRDMTYSDISDMSGMGYDRVKQNIERINSDMRALYANAM